MAAWLEVVSALFLEQDPVSPVSYRVIHKMKLLCFCVLLSRQWHQRLVVVQVAGASSAFGMFTMESVVIQSPTIGGQYRVLLSPETIASFFLLVSKI